MRLARLRLHLLHPDRHCAQVSRDLADAKSFTLTASTLGEEAPDYVNVEVRRFSVHVLVDTLTGQQTETGGRREMISVAFGCESCAAEPGVYVS